MKNTNKKSIKQYLCSILSLLMILTLVTPFKEAKAATTAERNPVSYYGEMQVSGNRINGEKTGRPVQAKGMSFFWSNWSSKFYTAQTVNKMVDEFNVEIVRAVHGVDDFGTPFPESNLDYVRTVVDAAIARGIYVIIDWHTHGAEKNVGAAKAFFETMAREYGQYDNVIFELYNEPKYTGWNDIKSYAEQVIPVIRKYSDNLVVVGTPTWSQEVDQAANNPINDPNVAYTLHFYAGTHKQDLRNKGNYALSKGIALFATEWGSVNADGNGGIDYNSTKEWMDWLDQNKISWANWAINDKNETSSIFNTDGSLTEAGRYLKGLITDGTKDSEWKTGPINPEPPTEPTLNGPVDYYGQLKTSGNKVFGAKTNTLAEIQGISFFWSQWSDKYYNAAMVDRLVDEFQVEIVRAAYGTKDDGTLDPEASEEAICEVVDRAIERGIYVIIDWHSHGAHKQPELAKAFFERMAAKYGQYDNVIFEVYNEPLNDVSWEQVKAYAEDVIPVIRKYSDNLVVVGTPFWSQDVDVASRNPITKFDNVAYVLHFYAGSHGQELRNKAQTAINNGAPLFVSEWGIWGPGASFAEADAVTWTNWLEEQKLSSCMWSVSDKDEPSSMFFPDGTLRPAGEFAKSFLANHAKHAPWRTAEPEKDPVDVLDGTKIEAENYVSMNGVEKENCAEGGQNVGYIEAGDWMKYKINVAEAGKYKIEYRVASQLGGGQITLKSNDTSLGDVNVGATGGWQNWTTVSHEVTLAEGVQEITLYAPNGGFNVNWIKFNSTVVLPNQAPVAIDDTVTTGKNTNITIDILSNDKDNDGIIDVSTLALLSNPQNGTVAISGGKVVYTPNADFTGTDSFTYTVKDNEGLTSNTATVTITVTDTVTPPEPQPSIKVEAENYIQMSGIQTENCGEGGQNVGYIDADDWLVYSVNIPTDGKYKVEYRVASQNGGGVLNLEQNAGTIKLGTVNVPSTGGWQNWQTVSHEVNLKAGEQIFGIGVPAGGFNLNWISFTKVDGTVDPEPPVDPEIPVDPKPQVTFGYTVMESWGNGGNARITITNNSDVAINNWTLEFNLSNSSVYLWDSQLVSNDGNHVVVKCKVNTSIAPGQTVPVEFTVQGNISEGPTNITIK